MMSTEELIGKAREVIMKLRNAEQLIMDGKLDDGIKLFKEATKEAVDNGLFDNYIAIIRRIRRLIINEKHKQTSKAEAKSGT